MSKNSTKLTFPHILGVGGGGGGGGHLTFPARYIRDGWSPDRFEPGNRQMEVCASMAGRTRLKTFGKVVKSLSKVLFPHMLGGAGGGGGSHPDLPGQIYKIYKRRVVT